jgi:carbon storage regulator
MLVLTRKPCERIQIGDSIVVTVVRVEGNAVRLGIEAPSDVAVYRQELLLRRQGRSHARPPALAAAPEKSV